MPGKQDRKITTKESPSYVSSNFEPQTLNHLDISRNLNLFIKEFLGVPIVVFKARL